MSITKPLSAIAHIPVLENAEELLIPLTKHRRSASTADVNQVNFLRIFVEFSLNFLIFFFSLQKIYLHLTHHCYYHNRN